MEKVGILTKIGDNRLTRYFKETWYEMKKVSWPTRREAVNLTLMVIAVTTFLAIVLGLMDWLFKGGLALLIGSIGAG
ncbi:MAG: preprotein translocase subunit SecE [Anaerolineae bacterium]|nr:preprotein translocase subunit SecE [Anaerolineae bacterium]